MRGRDAPTRAVVISIHAPRTGSDAAGGFLHYMHNHFNPRSPHGERHFHQSSRFQSNYFNPRSPHGERLCVLFMYNFKRYFNPRSPHGERRMTAEEAARLAISIHAPRTGSDRRKPRRKRRQSSFQSTLPARGATDLPATRHLPFVISIHAPRTGSDWSYRSSTVN